MRRGTRVGQAYVALTVDGDGINEEIVHSVDEAGPGVEKAGEDHGQRYGDNFSEGFFGRLRKRIGERFSHEVESEMGHSGEESGHTFTESFVKGLDDNLLNRVGDRLGSHFGGHLLNSLISAIDRDTGDNPIADLFDRLMDDAVSGNPSGDRRRAERLGDRIGGLFGAGSRNNALNILGSSIANIVNLTESAANGVGSIFKAIQTGGAEGASGEAVLAKMGEGLSTLIASGPAAAIALAAVAIGMTVLVSVASALLAIVTALAATITSALVGALAVGAAGLAALSAAAGLGVLAFMSMTDAQKAMLSSAMRPLHEEAIGLGQEMLTNLIPAFGQWAHNLQVALALADPLARIMGGALAEAGNIFTASLSGPGFQMFIATLSTIMLPLLTNLSGALGGFLNGSLALFSALLPFVLQFATYLDRVAMSFQTWAASAQGQNAIENFVGRALVSLQSLWNFVSAIGGLLSAVLFSSSGQKAGNNIFDRMAASVRQFTAYISKDNRLQNWFDEGVTLAVALGQAIKTIGRILASLNQSGVIDGIARLVDIGTQTYDSFSRLPGVLQDIIFPLKAVSDLVGVIGNALSSIGIGGDSSTDPNRIPGDTSSTNLGNLLSGTPAGSPVPTGPALPPMPNVPSSAHLNNIIGTLTQSGQTALANTTSSAANPLTSGNLTAAQMAQYQAMAAAIIKNGPTLASQISTALRNVHKTITNAITTSNKDFANTIRSTANSTDAASVTTALQNLVQSQSATIKNTVETLNTNAANLVSSAQEAVNSAAQQLGSATTKAQAASALRALNLAQTQLDQAQAAQVKISKQTAAMQAAIKAANKIVKAEGVLTQSNADALANGLRVTNATLADYADARAQIVEKLKDANQKLQDAVSLRDTYATTVANAVSSFAALTTAQAQTINGVTQALTASDITVNLQKKLDQIRKFQSDLNVLLARGLSQDAYKQLLDAGVDQGGAYATALVGGGQGAVAQVNQLTASISAAATNLGNTSANRLYQAGVDGAAALVNGLNSLSDSLAASATTLGGQVAKSVNDALVAGLGDPNGQVYASAMALGDSIAKGISKGVSGDTSSPPSAGTKKHPHHKAGSSSVQTLTPVAVSPEVAAYAASQRGDKSDAQGVSGNPGDPRFRDLIVQTPTTDPLAVGMEVLNEVVGRLP